MPKVPETIKHILIINVIFFIATATIKNYDLFEAFTLHFYSHPKFRFWQFATSIFLHFDFISLLFNLMGLYFLGTPLIQLWGKNKFIFFYVSASIGSGLLFLGIRQLEFQNAMNELIALGGNKEELIGVFNETKVFKNETVEIANRIYTTRLFGTSSVIYAMLAAYALYFPNGKFYLYFVIPVTVKYFVPIIVLISLVSSFMSQPIFIPLNHAFYGLFGILVGLIMALVWKRDDYRMN
ncbi:rhomboid family intramembrane serine protease [Wenyingzhuangia sp. IMCC45574]